MQVNEQLLTHLENLSYLKVSEDKRQEIINQLSQIVSFVDNLSQLDTNSINETFTMTNQATYLREDEPIVSSDINANIIKNAPRTENNFFIVPKIIE